MAVNASWPGVSRKVIGLVVVVHLVGADVLRDAAGLAGGDVGLADRVEQRRLAVVDVAHDRDDRRALDEVVVGVVERRARPRPRRRRGRSRSPCRTRRRGARSCSSVSVCVSVAISPMRHQLLDDLGDRDAEVLGDVLDRRAGVDPDRVGRASAGRRRDAAATSSSDVRRRRRRRRGGRVRRAAGTGTAGTAGPRRAACESMTTRRWPPPGPPSLRMPPRVGRPPRSRAGLRLVALGPLAAARARR